MKHQEFSVNVRDLDDHNLLKALRSHSEPGYYKRMSQVNDPRLRASSVASLGLRPASGSPTSGLDLRT